MNPLALRTALGVCLSALLVAALAGCSNSAPTSGQSGYGNRSGSGNPSGSGMRGAQGPGGPATSTPGGGGTGGSGPGGSGAGNGTGNGNGNGNGMMGGSSGSGNYSSAGERIWLTGVGTDGSTIVRSAPRVSQGALMMGGGGCGSCHAANGRGGTIRMMTGAEIKAPDVTYGALIKAGFTDATIRKAIAEGLDESGKPLKVAMPRWRMSSADMDATIAYLKALGGS